jgi:hypothetical protein
MVRHSLSVLSSFGDQSIETLEDRTNRLPQRWIITLRNVAGQRRSQVTLRGSVKSRKQNVFQRVSNAAWPLRTRPSSNHAAPTAAALAWSRSVQYSVLHYQPPSPTSMRESGRRNAGIRGHPRGRNARGPPRYTLYEACISRWATSSVDMLHVTREQLNGSPLYGTLKLLYYNDCGCNVGIRTVQLAVSGLDWTAASARQTAC